MTLALPVVTFLDMYKCSLQDENSLGHLDFSCFITISLNRCSSSLLPIGVLGKPLKKHKFLAVSSGHLDLGRDLE